MKTIYTLIFAVSLCVPLFPQESDFSYISPVPNSQFNTVQTSIILRSVERVERQTVSSDAIQISGSATGIHQGAFTVSDDQQTMLFKPDELFSPSETVSVSWNAMVRTVHGKYLKLKSFKFLISPRTMPFKKSSTVNEQGEIVQEAILEENVGPVFAEGMSSDTLPVDFPKITVGTPNNPYEGKIFLANKPAVSNPPYGNYILIADNNGNILKYKKFTKAESNFKVLPNGQLSMSENARHIVLDTSLSPIDTFKCGNGYTADSHDFLLLPNGHSLLLAYDSQPVDMSLIVPGGKPDATVIGVVIQELDASKNVVFQWRTWDHLPITSTFVSLTAQSVDYAHGNALEIDKEGNIYIVLRHTSNIVKINRTTGNVEWILGGKQNQFTFINEHESNSPNYFSYPHNMTILPNGNITLFDNGDQHTPMYSRGVEYALDEVNKTVTLVWEYRHSPDIYTSSGGSTQRLPNGNTIIGWSRGGSAVGLPAFTEVRPDKSVALEVFFPAGQFSYRSYKFPWRSQTPEASVTQSEVLQGNTYSFNKDTDSTGVTITFQQLTADMYSNAIVTSFHYAPVNPHFLELAPLMEPYYFTIQGDLIASYTGLVRIDVKKYPEIIKPKNTIVYVRPQFSTLFIPLSTSYDSLTNELLFTTSDFGEFAFGTPQIISAIPPIPMMPMHNEIVNGEAPVTLQWGTRGVVQTYHLQVSADSNFQNVMAEKLQLTSNSFAVNDLINNTEYFWRVRTANAAGTSAWSDVSAFRTSSPFIAITSPNGYEQLYKDSTYVIRWRSNVREGMRIELMKGSAVIVTIADSIVSRTNAALWKVPSSVLSDTSYKIKITSKIHPALTDSSDHTFIVAGGIAGIAGPEYSIAGYTLHQNYPNPFNPATTIRFAIRMDMSVSLTVFDLLGKEIAALVNGRLNAGDYSIPFNGENIPSGMYFYRLKAGNFTAVKRMILLK